MIFNTGAALLDAIVLAIVSRDAEGTYGYRITQDVRKAIEVSESTLYPVLRRLQKDDCLQVYDRQCGGRNRRYYKLTPSGEAQLRLYIDEWRVYAGKISALFSGEGVIMNKETFLSRLEQLLYDIPREEREEAMDYYRSYFEEAGEENEASVLEELDSPQEIAASIKADLKGPDSKAGRLKNPPQVRGMQKETHDSGEKTGYGFSEAGAHYRRYDEPRQSAQDQEFHGSSRAYGQYEKQTEKKKSGINLDKQAKLILLVIVAFFAFPVWGSLASVALGIIGIVIGAVVALGAFAAGGVIGGLVCSVVGIVNLCMLSVIKGLLALGTGLLLIAAGGICTVLMILICGRLIPKTVRQIISLLRRLLDWGRRVA